MKINNTTLIVGLAGIGAIAYFYFKKKKGTTETIEQAYDDGLGGGIGGGGGGSFGLPMGIPVANPIVINNTPTTPTKPSKKEALGQVESMPQAIASAPSLGSTPIVSTSTNPYSGGTNSSGQPVSSIHLYNKANMKASDVKQAPKPSAPAMATSLSSVPLSSGFIDFDGNEDIQRSALDFDVDID
ncbi:MAG: hypothetical protein ABF244_00630 [Flavobacteriaceae bacterium]